MRSNAWDTQKGHGLEGSRVLRESETAGKIRGKEGKGMNVGRGDTEKPMVRQLVKVWLCWKRGRELVRVWPPSGESSEAVQSSLQWPAADQMATRAKATIPAARASEGILDGRVSLLKIERMKKKE
ncbi:uncharacterized protein MELLADRAFT_101325 [Melampsora larici-populina 98AG31]|uniref:Uncharacterized protein n=1 Tax=Melampsora larici-populina (strain 98AG31 / pathotype 3-4-7) TaxID=747676 RepID=F4R4D3_MELLP|nr:uncharacterized protein MELLADRAFT_101325 [Melampsora larici-populina 98AG31]EGG13023.1 hypothetical protein MELLADRAFT_101325 [Melampsora larici-populina 98AG31]